MNFFIKRINHSMTRSSATVIIFTSLAIGMLLGLIRTQLINANFNSWLTGAYFSAFKLPEFLLFTLGAGALSVAFIPVLSDKLSKGSRQEAWKLTSSVLNTMTIVMFFLCLILVIFPKPILYLIAEGLSPERLDIAAQIMRLAAIGPLVFSVSYILGSVQQVMGRFIFLAIAPIFYNLSIIVSMYLFKDSMGIVCLGLGAAIGGILNLIILGFGMNRLKFRHVWRINLKDKFYRQVFKALPFRSFDQGTVYMNSIVQLRLASFLPVQTITNLENALMLYNAPITLLGVALGTATFPKFTKRLSQNRPDLFKKEFLEVLRAMIWISLPVIIACYVCRDYLAKLIFTQENSEIAMVFAWLCLGILFRTMYAIISRFYYAQKDTLTPMMVTVVAFASNWALSWWLSKEMGIVGFGIATSLVTIIEIVILISIIKLRHKDLLNLAFAKRLVPPLLVGLVTFGLAFASINLIDLSTTANLFILVIQLGIVASLIGLIYFGLSYLCKIKEAFLLLKYVKNVFKKLSGALYERKT